MQERRDKEKEGDEGVRKQSLSFSSSGRGQRGRPEQERNLRVLTPAWASHREVAMSTLSFTE